jgi:hypothetical protein
MRFIWVIALAACGAQLPSSTNEMLGPTPNFTTLSTTPGAFAGTWTGDGRTLTLDENGQQVTGTITVAGLTGTVQALIETGKLVGTFTLGSGSNHFTATLQGERLMFAVEGGQAQPLAHAATKPKATTTTTTAASAACYERQTRDRLRTEVTHETLKLDGAGNLTLDTSVTKYWGDSATASFAHAVGNYVLDGQTLRVMWKTGKTATLDLASYKRC